MDDVQIKYPPIPSNRGLGYWLRPSNVWVSRRKIFRSDYSTEWRKTFVNPSSPVDRSVPFSALVPDPLPDQGFRFLILGDTGEGDRSQYSLLPLIRSLSPAFIIINGDVAYPAGRIEDFEDGFFKPYEGLQVPIWAVPGNHEYYSKNQGREFYEIFCTRVRAKRWAEADLRLVPQPGTYWELRDPTAVLPLVVIGIDTGKAGDLDGKGKQGSDTDQHTWLNARLKLAQQENRIVIVLFHIPALANNEQIKKTSLFQLHHVLAKYPCVRLVVGAHYHNYQYYSQNVFREFLNEIAPATKTSGARPTYLIAGDSGAALSSVRFKKKDYPADEVYPSLSQWEEYETIGRRTVDAAGFSRTLVGRLVALVNKEVRSDFDPPGFLSFLSVDVTPGHASVQPVFMDHVRLLYANQPPGSVVHIQDASVPLDQSAVKYALRSTPLKLVP